MLKTEVECWLEFKKTWQVSRSACWADTRKLCLHCILVIRVSSYSCSVFRGVSCPTHPTLACPNPNCLNPDTTVIRNGVGQLKWDDIFRVDMILMSYDELKRCASYLSIHILWIPTWISLYRIHLRVLRIIIYLLKKKVPHWKKLIRLIRKSQISEMIVIHVGTTLSISNYFCLNAVEICLLEQSDSTAILLNML